MEGRGPHDDVRAWGVGEGGVVSCETSKGHAAVLRGREGGLLIQNITSV